MRKVNLPDLPEWQAPAKRETIELELRLITPMFGGGYKAREVDPLQPIRPAAIRGHLRFWWRATAGARYTSVADLHKAETELWGGASTKGNPAVGKVALQVHILSAGEKAPYTQVAPPSKPKDGPLHGYFLFPFREQREQNIPAAVGRKQIRFQLCLTLDASLSEAQRAEVRTALKAWIAFGGVGARTRRGCGALTVVGANANQWLPPTQGLAQWLGMPPNAGSKCDWTTLAGAQGIVVPKASPEEAWSELGRFWARFRKGHFPKNYSPMSGGKWRDYRHVLCQLRNQGNTLRLAKPFLGLPIIYQEIKGAKNLCFTGTLEPAESGRLASPVILKPIALQGGKYGALILVMHAPKPNTIKIEGKDYALAAPTKDPVLQALDAADVLDAVLKGAKRHFEQQSVSFRL
ncbi:MAG: type III-B CRISPR module RAMP protein Cmr1 [Armatimonadetes bacterium]|nr:type III-B CRISPR module RAMP protein Cmr1 [Armatimonadota bacterium]